jgi:hypothetical protein
MPPKSTKKRTRSSNVAVNPPKPLRISVTPPLTPEPSQAWERQQLESQPQDSIRAPTEGSHAAAEGTHASAKSVATIEAAGDDYINNGGDDYNGLDWDRLGRRYMKPLSQLRRAKSWIYQYGYRVVYRDAPTRQFWVCKYCHTHKLPSGIIDVSQATSSTAAHLGQPARGHNLNRMGLKTTPKKRPSGQLSLREALAGGFKMPQATANAIGNFDIQRFRYAVVL